MSEPGNRTGRRSPFAFRCPDCGRQDGNGNFVFAHMYRDHMNAHPGETPWMNTQTRELGWVADESELVPGDVAVIQL